MSRKPTGWVCVVALGAAVVLAGSAPASGAQDVVINEFWVEDMITDSAEYIELYNKGASAVNLDDYSVIIVDGDTSGYHSNYDYRRVTLQVHLTGTLNPGEYYLIGAGLTPDRDYEIRLYDIQNGTQTFAFVWREDIGYEEDGVHLHEDSIKAIKTNPKTDAVTNFDGTEGDDSYFDAPIIGNPSGHAWGTASRIPNGTGAWSNANAQNNYQTVELGNASDGLGSPGVANGWSWEVPRWGACCIDGSCTYQLQAACTGEFKGAWRDCSHPDDPCVPPTPRNLQYVKDKGLYWGGRIGPVVITSMTDTVGSTASRAFVVQDLSGDGETRGLTIFGLNGQIDALLQDRQVGELITIEGTTSHFNGLFQLTDNYYKPLVFVTHDGPGAVPDPVTGETCETLSDPDRAEQIESTWVTLDCVTFLGAVEGQTFGVGSTYVITDGTGYLEVIVPTEDCSAAGTAVPTTPVALTGVLSQYDPTEPMDAGYQLILINEEDIDAPSAGCVVGRCCLPAGSCMMTSEPICDQFCGTWGAGVCDPNTCVPVTTGACILPNQTCVENVTATTCSSQSGTYWGDGSTCDGGPCFREVTVDGAHALGVGSMVALKEVVVTSTTDLIASSTSKSFYVQDTSGVDGAPRGLTVYGKNEAVNGVLYGPDGTPDTADDVVEGDRIKLAGMLIAYANLLELGVPLQLIAEFSPPAGIPTPTIVSTEDLQSANGEPFESTLVLLPCVTFTTTGVFAYGNFTVTDGVNNVTVRVSTAQLDLVVEQMEIPTVPVNIRGIVTQFNSTYQIMVRSKADIQFECSEYCYTCRGDANGDNTIDLNDLAPFVAALLGTERHACADVNADEATDGDDVQAFVDLILAPPPRLLRECDESCPESSSDVWCSYTPLSDPVPGCEEQCIPAYFNDDFCVVCDGYCPEQDSIVTFKVLDAFEPGKDCVFMARCLTGPLPMCEPCPQEVLFYEVTGAGQ